LAVITAFPLFLGGLNLIVRPSYPRCRVIFWPSHNGVGRHFLASTACQQAVLRNASLAFEVDSSED